MSESFSFDVTLAHKIKRAMIRNCISDAAVLDWLAAGDNIRKVQRVQLGLADIVQSAFEVDMRKAPYVPNGLELFEHQPFESLIWDPKKLRLYTSKDQTKQGLKGDFLREALWSAVPNDVLNANLLEFLLENQGLIPEEWKWKAIFFWGTIYTDANNAAVVRYLYWRENRRDWYWSWQRLDALFYQNHPALLLRR